MCKNKLSYTTPLFSYKKQSFNNYDKKDGEKMDNLMTEATLSDSYIFTQLNRSSNASSTIVKAIQTGVILDKSYIEEQYIQCKRSRVSPIMTEVLEAFDAGEIVLVYNKQVRVSTAIPFVVITISGKTKAYIFVSDFSALSKDESALTIEMKKLYVLMEAAYIAKTFYTNPNQFKKSGVLIKIMASIYSGMAMRIFNKEFALSLDKDVYDNVNYSMSRFFIENMLEIKNEQVSHAYAVSTCLNPNQLLLTQMSDSYKSANIKSVDELIKYVATLSPKMKKLNFRYFFERWVSTFGTSACLSVDTFPYLYFVVINVLLGSFLINTPTISDMVKTTKQINLFYAEIKKII